MSRRKTQRLYDVGIKLTLPMSPRHFQNCEWFHLLSRGQIFIHLRSEEAVEYDELSTFLRLDETWDEEIDGERPAPPVQPVGVPGASSPSQMTNHKPSFAASPSPLRSKNKDQSAQEFDVGTELVGFGLQGVKVTDDELLDLVNELGLNDADAGELVKGLGGEGKRVDDPKTSQINTRSSEAKGEQETGDESQIGDAKPVVDVQGDAATPAIIEAKSEQGVGEDSKDINKDKHDEEGVRDVATLAV